jgi:GT2 family glycosyltransferase
LHGDDCVRDGFYSKLQKAFNENPQLGAAFCRHIYMDERGNWTGISEIELTDRGILPNWLEKIASQQRIQTPSIVVRREVYESLGGFDRRFCCSAEDWEMWVRIAAANYPIWYELEPLALYRNGLSSLTANSIRSGNNIQDFRKAIEIMQEYLPEDNAHKFKKKALNFSAKAALRYANQLAIQNDFIGMSNQIKQALISSLVPSVIKSSLVLLTRFFYNNII